MNALMNNRLRLERWLAKHTLKRPLHLSGPQGVVSFTFDDAPRSACITGREILEHAGCHGSYYLAGGLLSQEELGRPCHTPDDVRALVSAGHHVGCHTWGHQRCDLMSGQDMTAEIQRNREFLTDFGVPIDDRHFCYPLGGYHLKSKQLVSQNYSSGRVNFGGLQVGVADLSALRAQSLYERLLNLQSLPALMGQVASQKGWLILYTHDVEDSPSHYGCTPRLLRSAVQHALKSGCKVLPVNEAIRYWQSS